MTEIISLASTFFTAALGWLGECIEFIVDTPYLLLGVVLMLAGFVFGLLKRAISKG